MKRGLGRLAAALVLAVAMPACSGGGGTGTGTGTGGSSASDQAMATIPVTVTGARGRHVFTTELAKTAGQQEKGLMYRTGIKPDQAMLFWPYPAGGGKPQVANFWMKNTPSALDIIFIRADGTVAHIAENAVPFSETLIPSGEPVGAVLEIVGGRAADLGIAEGDKVSWPGK
jgi:hypothetical protein